MTAIDSAALFTIGHSNHSLENFLTLLQRHQITALGDVRSSPYSRYCPQFNQASLKAALARANITYLFLGKELGARPADPAILVNGRVSYARLAMRAEFQVGLQRVNDERLTHRLALICAEKDPTECHRMILICRHVRSPDLTIQHILADGSLETNTAAERRLCDRLRLHANLFESEAEVIEQAYDRQSEKIAFVSEEIEPV